MEALEIFKDLVQEMPASEKKEECLLALNKLEYLLTLCYTSLGLIEETKEVAGIRDPLCYSMEGLSELGMDAEEVSYNLLKRKWK